jgi:hypothetical protein
MKSKIINNAIQDKSKPCNPKAVYPKMRTKQLEEKLLTGINERCNR